MNRREQIMKDYNRFCKDRTPEGYEKAITELMEEQRQEEKETEAELLKTLNAYRNELSLTPIENI